MGTYFGNAIMKYGWDNFEHDVIISDISKENACQLEIALIAQFKSNNREYGYNISEGGQTADYIRDIKGLKHPNHKRVKMIDTITRKTLRIFDSQTSAAEIMGINRKGITKACQGISATYKGYIWEYADYDFEKPIHNGSGNYKHDKIQKPIIMIDEEGVTHRFNSIKEASIILGINKTNISRYVKGTRKDKKRRWFYAS
jgi:hypothetical protein